MAAEWKRGSVLALDAGVHLAAITKIFEKQLPSHSPRFPMPTPILIRDGPFQGFRCPHASSAANAAYVTRELIDTYVITHPHLDHISAFVVNTASLQGTRPKRLAGLPSTIEAFKRHIFNNVIWPNLSDENNGAGLVTYLRLVEGDSPALDESQGQGYTEVAVGLSIKTWSISHGHCMERHSHRGSSVGLHRISNSGANTPLSPTGGSTAALSPAGIPRSDSSHVCVYDSSAYFVRDIYSGKELLMFGDVEPDSVSLSPRNRKVWMEAAPKVVAGVLKGIFIECSYDDSHPDEKLFGHLAPQYLIEELKVLVSMVEAEKNGTLERDNKKRKRQSNGLSFPPRGRPSRPAVGVSNRANPDISPRTVPHIPNESLDEISEDERTLLSRSGSPSSTTDPFDMVIGGASIPHIPSITPTLSGIKIVIIHMKEKLDDDFDVGVKILEQLKKYEETEKLGVEFIVSRHGQSLYF